MRDQAIRDTTDIQEAYETGIRDNFERYKDMLECYDILLGDHLTTAQLDWHKKWDLTARSYNITLAQVVTYDGYNINNRVNVRILPTEPDDAKMAGYATEALQQSYRECDAHEAIRKANLDAVICGYGYRGSEWTVGGKYPDGMLNVFRVNPFNVLEDMSHGEPDLNAGQFRMVHKWLSPDRLISAFAQDDPELAAMIERASELVFGKDFREQQRSRYWSLYKGGQIREINYKRLAGLGADSHLFNGPSLYIDTVFGLVKTLEIHFFQPTKREVIIDPSTEEIVLIPKKHENKRDALSRGLEWYGLDERAIVPRQVMEARMAVGAPGLLPRTLLVDEEYAVQIGQLSIQPISAYNYDIRAWKKRGIVHQIRDIQMRVNAAMSYQEDQIKRDMHPDWLIPKGSIDDNDPLDLETWKSKKIGRLLMYNAQAGGEKPTQLRNENLAQLLNMDMTVNLDLAPRITGISPTLGGMKDSAKDGADLFASMVQQGEIMISPLLEEAKTANLRCSKYDFALLQTFMVFPRWLRVTGSGGDINWRESVRLNQYDPELGRAKYDITVGRYDIVPDTSYMSPTERDFRFRQRMEFSGSLPPLMREFSMKHIIKLSGWPDSDDYIRIWRMYIYFTYGAQVLDALESEEKADKAMTLGLLDPNLLEKKAMIQQFLLGQGGTQGLQLPGSQPIIPSGGGAGMQTMPAQMGGALGGAPGAARPTNGVAPKNGAAPVAADGGL